MNGSGTYIYSFTLKENHCHTNMKFNRKQLGQTTYAKRKSKIISVLSKGEGKVVPKL